ncbi:MAG TPA: glycosyltransferase, partial [Firmicutes bacterium]|nr:glycosyltransferase [Bacillota bacterium]
YDSDQGEKSRLESLANDIGIGEKVMFLGERDDAADIFSAYDVAVHLPDHDYLPFGILECMALGKACLCTNVGGVPDLISDGETGLMVPPGDYKLASSALIKLLSDSNLREKLGKSAQNMVLQRYNLDRLVERVQRMYTDAIMGKLKPVYDD